MITTVTSLPGTMTVELKILTPPSEWEGKWRFIEVWRSILGEGGPYEPLFSSSFTPARVPTGGGGPYLLTGGRILEGLDGKTLEIVFGTTKLSYTHPDNDPIAITDFADLLEAAFPVKAWIDEEYNLVLETLNVGDSALMEILPSDLASTLGLPLTQPASVGVGRNPPIALTPGNGLVTFTDRVGSATYFYKSRYSDGTFMSEWSPPQSGERWENGVDPSRIAVGYVRISTMGTPSARQRVIVRTAETSRQGDWTSMVDEVSGMTDQNGLVELQLLRGVLLDVSFPGTGIVRRVKLPETGNYFDLMSDVVAADDGLGIHKIETVYAERRN